MTFKMSKNSWLNEKVCVSNLAKSRRSLMRLFSKIAEYFEFSRNRSNCVKTSLFSNLSSFLQTLSRTSNMVRSLFFSFLEDVSIYTGTELIVNFFSTCGTCNSLLDILSEFAIMLSELAIYPSGFISSILHYVPLSFESLRGGYTGMNLS